MASPNTFYHGTSVDSAERLLAGEPLNAAVASAAKIDGPPGFFLATHPDAAEYFALRRQPGTILRYDLTDKALSSLLEGGAELRPIPRGALPGEFPGVELHIPTESFDRFNALRDSGEISVAPYFSN
jgi:hypothetical protein